MGVTNQISRTVQAFNFHSLLPHADCTAHETSMRAQHLGFNRSRLASCFCFQVGHRILARALFLGIGNLQFQADTFSEYVPLRIAHAVPEFELRLPSAACSGPRGYQIEPASPTRPKVT
jgi:hypothetical protein